MTMQKNLIIGLLVLLFVFGLTACKKKKTTSPEMSYENTWTEKPSTNNTGPETSLPTWGKDYTGPEKITNWGGNSTGGDSSGGSSSGGDGGNQEPSQPSESEKPEGLHFEYFRVYLPWAGVNDGSGNWEYTWVNSTNTNRINQLWRKFIKREYYANEPFYIRNHKNQNSQGRFKDGNDYFYFDDNLDIRYAGMKETILKKYVAGVIIQYYGGSYNGVYTIGGLYRTYAKKNNSGNWGNDGVNMFMGIDIEPMRKPTLNGFKGDLEVIVVNLGKKRADREISSANPKAEYAIDIYYSDQQHDKDGKPVYQAWIEDETSYIGKNPRNFYEGKLNRQLLLSEGWYYNKYFYSFVPYWDK
ncbi:hypothetical protein [Brachyspira sp.]|uniref:hypothetical protein n=1 Tax=Brachyspira sp. TaxID=1977261 RepID=UPI003D7ED623